MKYKMIVSDLDGTLLNSEHKISKHTIDIIRKVTETGVKFSIATGRHFKDAEFFFKQVGVGSYLISGNGSLIHDKNGNEIGNTNMNSEITKRLIELKIDDEISRNIYYKDKWYTQKMIEAFGEYHVESKFSPIESDLKEFKNKKIEKVFFYCDDYKKIEKLEKEMLEDEWFKGKVNITTSHPSCLEIMDISTNKKEGILEIMKHENIKADEILAFGDAFNDNEMLSFVGKGIIMGNGDKKLKELLPDCEVIGTNNEDGEAKYLEEMFLK
ncbi:MULTISPECIES: Cof-type HAD-IIB family hydrolase [Fusobacterium]|uniref:Cof-type HAD-IIB family hydrolase n=1 Tax=Fusobacterium TaxID=848 RepID=UPI001476E496|nr:MULTISPECIES: Cof-type HAD-IIB family hydrolase [Fusobacterium]NME35327.1 HAD family phosphatase [Fusobacterium sp. FSA-380-WT-3A]